VIKPLGHRNAENPTVNCVRSRKCICFNKRFTLCGKTLSYKAFGAGEGNRTLVCSLGSCRSAIELRPQTIDDISELQIRYPDFPKSDPCQVAAPIKPLPILYRF
jgi:hypothetical protein